ncbi:MAG: MFS transporter [Verrucomicrobiota bacterium]|nr:MFS transporter [Limisphaera sp.]MDW8380871.1 MFS transporter [Verrucomicrobiota bacterium]
MHTNRFRYYLLTALNSFGTTLFFYYFYFFTQRELGFDNRSNLWLAALQGAVYAMASWRAGRIAERLGYERSLCLGLILLGACLVSGLVVCRPFLHVWILVGATLGVCFTWPALEALVNHGENRVGIQRNVGLYNVVWAGTGAVAYFAGGVLLESLGMRALYLLPLGIVGLELALVANVALRPNGRTGADPSEFSPLHTALLPCPGRTLLRMAWLANPFAYMAIQTLVALMPAIATRLGLSTASAGVCGSLWCFSRLGAFALLCVWAGWHYRARWLIAAYGTMSLSFVCILLTSALEVLVIAQLFFGAALGLIYYSSLFYSMDVSQAKATHGGIHEAAIGLGNLLGPLVGAIGLHLAPSRPELSAIAVTILLAAGGLALITQMRLTPRM